MAAKAAIHAFLLLPRNPIEAVSEVALASRIVVIFEHRSGACVEYVSTGAQKIALDGRQSSLLE